MKPSPCVFMIAYSLAYAFVFWMDWPLFSYYPLHGDFVWGVGNLDGAGPSMAWYGLMADALIFGFVMSMLIPDRLLGRFVKSNAWVLPVATMAVSVYLLRALIF